MDGGTDYTDRSSHSSQPQSQQQPATAASRNLQGSKAKNAWLWGCTDLADVRASTNFI